LAGFSTYTITANDFIFLQCSKAVEESGFTLPQTFKFIECPDDPHTTEEAVKHRKLAKVYSIANLYCSGFQLELSDKTRKYLNGYEYIGDDKCPIVILEKDKAPTEDDKPAPTENINAKKMFESTANSSLTYEYSLADARTAVYDGFTQSVKDSILSGKINVDALKDSAINALKDAAPGVLNSLASTLGVDSKTLSAITDIVDFVGSDNILNGDIDAIKKKLLEQLELKNLVDIASKPEITEMLSKALNIGKDTLTNLFDSSKNIKTLSDIKYIETYTSTDDVFKVKLIDENYLDTRKSLDLIVSASVLFYSDDEKDRIEGERIAKGLASEFLSLLTPIDTTVSEDTMPDQKVISKGTWLTTFSKIDYRIQKVAAIGLGFGIEEEGVTKLQTYIDNLNKYQQLNEKSNELREGLKDHTETLEEENRYNPDAEKDYKEKHGLTDKQYEDSLGIVYNRNLNNQDDIECTQDWEPSQEEPNVNDPIYVMRLDPALTVKDSLGNVISYNGDIILTGRRSGINTQDNDSSDNQLLTSIPFKIKNVNGVFICKNMGLKSLENAPDVVEGDFDCSGNELVSLDFGPKSVGGNYIANKNKLENLDGLPSSIGQNLNLSENRISSLENLGCGKSSTTSGCPTTVFGDVNLSDNDLKSLNNANLNIRGILDVSKNELTDATIFTGVSDGLGGKNENFNSDIRIKKFIGINQQPDGVGKLNSSLIQKTLQIDNIIV
jgi:hypothetical protein